VLIARLLGYSRRALVASMPSPLYPQPPMKLPATVEINPVFFDMRRMQQLSVSSMYTSLVDGSTLTALLKVICEAVAGPPSPLYPATPVPAIVLIMPELFVTIRMTTLPESAM
jgi:hypothetical protein